MRTEPEYIRTVAGLLLKNHIKEVYSHLPEEVKEYIKQQVLACVGDAATTVRRTVGSIISMIILKGSLKDWPALLPVLIQHLDSGDMNSIDGAFNALFIICEDYSHKLDSEELGRPLNFLIPKFLEFFKSKEDSLRKYAISCMNQFLVDMPGALLVNMDNYLQVRTRLGVLNEIGNILFI